MVLNVQEEQSENRYLKRFTITERDAQGNSIRGNIARNQIHDSLRQIVKNGKSYSISVLVDGMFRSGKTFNKNKFDNHWDENKYIFSNTEWYNDHYEATNEIQAVRIYEYE